MIYLVLAFNLLVLGLAATFVVRLVRASPERRNEMLHPTRKTIITTAAAFVGIALITLALLLYCVSFTGMRASWAAKDYLKAQFGARANWRIELSGHVERSKKPSAGSYQIHYRYGEKSGSLVADYVERDGKLIFNITPVEQ